MVKEKYLNVLAKQRHVNVSRIPTDAKGRIGCVTK